MRQLHVAQLDSVHRLGASSPAQLAEEVTYAKARATQVAAYALIREDPSPEEREAEAAAAVWLQLCDDALDRREDRLEGRQTLLTPCHRFSDAAEVLERHRLAAFAKLRGLRHLDPLRLEEYLFRWYVVASVGMTYLYLDYQVEHGALPAIRLRDAVPLAFKLVAEYRLGAAAGPIELPGTPPVGRRGGV
ncbi:hypothetical protein [Nannocystis pusilla]|uniref:hypothetical protein n=1 Tax=Nannocystis pusilla TaxID=889268 RepID=UPI003DA4E17D